ncbi:MAG: hypothetical protein PHX18_04220 [Candidatus Gastranaerophilales bacterium]|nr:hypothetical protein [Candidatus Gastranaerophilales bacterium]
MKNTKFNFLNTQVQKEQSQVTDKNGTAVSNPSDSMGSIFSSGNNSVNVNFSQSSGSMGGVQNIFSGTDEGGFYSEGSIFGNGYNNKNNYSIFNKQNYNREEGLGILTEEKVLNQKNSDTPKRTNPKSEGIDIPQRENPFAAFRNPDPEFDSQGSIGESLSFLNPSNWFNKNK